MKVGITKYLKDPKDTKQVNGDIDTRLLERANAVRKARRMTWDEFLEALLLAVCEAEETGHEPKRRVRP